MPRALTPNVRSLAHADSPVLPFLAPRALQDAPTRHGRKQDTFLSPARTQDATPLLQTRPLSSSRRLAKPLAPVSSPLGLRYVDIYSFAQRRLAHGAAALSPSRPGTDDRSGVVPSPRSRPRASPSQSHALRCGRVNTTSRGLLSSAPTPVRSRRSSRPKGVLLDHRRVKQLKLEASRYKTFKTYERERAERRGRKYEWDSLNLRGQYRSLKRRIYALSQKTETEVDLTTPVPGHPWRSVTIWAFAALNRRVHDSLRRRSHHIKIRHDPRMEDWVSRLCAGVNEFDPERMLLNWMGVSEAGRNASWHFILLYLLEKRPHHALQFLSVLSQEPFVATLKPDLLADALEHVATLATRQLGKGQSELPFTSEVIPVFESLFSVHLARHRRICTQELLLNLARIASLDDLQRLLNLFDKHRVQFHFSTLLHFANAFGSFGDHASALRCMQKVAKLGKKEVINHKRSIWSCALILRRSMRDKQNYHLTTEIVADFVKLGVKLDILIYNIIMHNAMEARDYDTAFRVYNLLDENQIEPDKYTFGILLHGCTMANDPSVFRDFAEFCARRAKEMEDPWLATDYLHWLYVQHKNEDPQQLSEILHDTYAQFFSPEPLKPFLRSVAAEAAPDSANMTAPNVSIYIMLQTIIREALAAPKGNEHVWNLYEHFTRLVREGNHPQISELAKQPSIWNAFLLAFCRRHQFANASHLVSQMTDGEIPDIPQPNVYSWNIFLQAFFRNEQSRAAERIYEIMRSRGVEPDQFTYEVLLHGYARSQQIEKIGQVMAHIDDEEMLDPRVLQALSRIHDRKKLMFALEEARMVKEEEKRRKAELAEARKEEMKKRVRIGSLFGKAPFKL